MQRMMLSLAATTCILASLWANAPAYAAFATWVSSAGDDSNPCTAPDLPCRQLSGAAGALAKTNAGGIVHVLPGDYLAFRVAFAVNIIAEDPGQAAISGGTVGLGAFDAGISIETAAATDIVRVRGMAVVRHGSSGGGIMLQSTGILHVEDCTFVGGGNSFGIVFAPTGAGELHVSNSTLSDNGLAGAAGGGILVKPTGSGSAKVVLENVLVDNNRVGILVDGAASTGGIDMGVSDSTISGSTAQGLSVFEAVSGGSPSKVQVARTTISSNGSQGIFASRSSATVRVRQSEITGNAVGVGSANGGQIISHGDNLLADNTTNGAFTATLPPQ